MTGTGLRLIGIFSIAVPIAVAALASDAPPAKITFYKNVLPILQQNCQTCHRPGGENIAGMVAPMPLITYDEVRPWARSMARQVSTRTMPPWHASPEFHGIFLNERSLTDEEIGTLVRWVKGGAVRGTAEDAPTPATFTATDGWVIGRPDLIIKLPEPYFVPDDIEDQYITFSTQIPEELLPKDQWLRAIEWKPDSEVVHHIVGYSFVERPDGEPEREGLGSIAPGEEPQDFPAGYGKRLRKGTTIYFSMHYHKEAGPGTGVWDHSSVGFRFWDPENDPPVRHVMHWEGISNHSFEIPPGQSSWEVGAAKTFERDSTILSLHPHMHLRGKDALYEAVYPDGTRERLLYVPRWDFNWQTNYIYRQPKQVPAGTRLEVTVHYDNSADNLNNPDPTIPIRWGGPTTDEMMIGYINYCDTEPMPLESESQRDDEIPSASD